jgi:ribosomal protein L11 methyltransferase
MVGRMPWLELRLRSSQPEWVEEILTAHGAQAISFEDAGDTPILEPAPGTTPLWQDTAVRALFSPNVDWTRVRGALEESLAAELWCDWEVLRVDDHDWVRAWQAQEQPRRFGERLWVCPTHALVDLAAEDVLVWLDAGLGFGTGAHPTTALCLEWLAHAELSGRRVLDYGCGSGILAIAALRLGAAAAVAVDIDPQALTASRDNAERNGLSDRLQVTSPEAAPPLRDFDVVLANILARPLIELAPRLMQAAAPRACLVLTGILHEQADSVRAAYAPRVVQWQQQNDEPWVALIGRCDGSLR